MISIIIPAYNAEKYITETINSVINQTYTDWELIIINDGSIDNTAEIVKQFCANDNRIKYYYQNNSGVSAARNNGLKRANGEYIVFLDSDDVWLKEFLEKTVSFLDKNKNIGVVNTNVKFIDKDSNKLDIIYTGINSDNILNMLFFKTSNKTTGPSGTVCRTQLVKQIKGFDTNLSNVADKMFYLDIAKITTIVNINDILWLYRYYKESMHKNINNIINDYESYIKQIELKKHISDNKEMLMFKKIIFKICLAECLKNKKLICSFKYLKKYLF